MRSLLHAFWILLVLFSANRLEGETLYVDDDAPLGGDGLSWNTAFKYLKDGLAAAGPSTTVIRVAQGVYRPDQSETGVSFPGYRNATFSLVSGLSLKGGYSGLYTEDPDARNIVRFVSILSGDLNGDDQPGFVNYEENSCHVVTINGVSCKTLIEGFTIQSANTTGHEMYFGGGINLWDCSPKILACTIRLNLADQYGGGLACSNGSPEIGDCIIQDNRAIYIGGGMSLWSADPIITKCSFERNESITDLPYVGGGGFCCLSYSNPTLEYCTFTENFARNAGGGICSLYSSPTISHCSFTKNTALGSDIEYGGGAIYGYGAGTVLISHCHIADNYSEKAGGGINCDEWCTAEITECTIIRNITDGWMYSHGGGVHCRGNLTMSGCDISENEAVSGGGIYLRVSPEPTIINCRI
ncbi:MAG: right-handed parallel beta-helix repeat-containing protein, partial [Planctomycetes bacterium]|nr:right-handed parallel beta-helix repeat-containing protein [Planctomycetota bacterium]